MDSAFDTAPYSGYTTDELRLMLRTRPGCLPIIDEVYRRERVLEGDVSVMTPGERLRFIQIGKAR